MVDDLAVPRAAKKAAMTVEDLAALMAALKAG
jgi:hypothetical protein